MVFPIKLYDDHEYQKLSTAARCLLHVAYSRSNGQGFCWPSINTLAKDIGKSQRWTNNILKELQGFIVIECRKGRSSIIRPMIPRSYDPQITPEVDIIPTPDPQIIPPMKWTSPISSKEVRQTDRLQVQVKTQEKPKALEQGQGTSKSMAYSLMSSSKPIKQEHVQVHESYTGNEVGPKELNILLRLLPKNSKYPVLTKKCLDLIPKAIEIIGGFDKLKKAAENYNYAVLYNGETPQAPQYWLSDRTYELFIDYSGPTSAPEPKKKFVFTPMEGSCI
jgi:hypothetical protein